MDDHLRSQLEQQLHRLVDQLSDLEELKEDLDEEERKEMKEETQEQLSDFQEKLERMEAGDVTLQDELGAMKAAIQAAIADAFQTPEVIRLFALQQPGQLRTRLAEVQRDVKLGKKEEMSGRKEIVETLAALKKLGEQLTSEETEYLRQHRSASMRAFEKVEEERADTTHVVRLAGSQIKAAQQ